MERCLPNHCLATMQPTRNWPMAMPMPAPTQPKRGMPMDPDLAHLRPTPSKSALEPPAHMQPSMPELLPGKQPTRKMPMALVVLQTPAPSTSALEPPAHLQPSKLEPQAHVQPTMP